MSGEQRTADARMSADGHDLSEGEERIALLAASGRRNDEIAAELGLRPKTIEWNLTRIYRKLGVRSRTELAARAAEIPAAGEQPK